MKTPRVHDFDPTAKIPELTSPLDGMPAIQKPKPAGIAPVQEPASFQSPHQSTDRSTKRSINQSTVLGNKILEKPKAFYITERLNQLIDEAVRYYQEKHNIKKVDRSVVVTAMLENEAYWTAEAL